MAGSSIPPISTSQLKLHHELGTRRCVVRLLCQRLPALIPMTRTHVWSVDIVKDRSG